MTGTYQEGYANREMLNSGEEKAVFVGYALVRGCGLHFDVKANEDKDEEKKESQEEDLYHENDVAPVVVLTNDERDAVVYSVYAVPCDAIISNLFDSGLNARLMGVSSDTAAIDLAAAETNARPLSRCASERRVWIRVDDVIFWSTEEEFSMCETAI